MAMGEAFAKRIDKDACCPMAKKSRLSWSLSGSRIGLTANNLHNIYLRLFVESNWMREAGFYGAANSVSALMNKPFHYMAMFFLRLVCYQSLKLSCEKLTKAGVIAQLKETNAWSEITVREDSNQKLIALKRIQTLNSNK